MLIISDSNIFIDMEVGELTRHMFQLPEKIGTPNILYEEELAAQHSELPALGLLVMNVEEEYMDYVSQWLDRYIGPSFHDLTAMALAKQENCTLLTGDPGLRTAAETELIDVHGTLWLMERMFVEKIITHTQADKAYKKMRNGGRRLPWPEIKDQLKGFKKS